MDSETTQHSETWSLYIKDKKSGKCLLIKQNNIEGIKRKMDELTKEGKINAKDKDEGHSMVVDYDLSNTNNKLSVTCSLLFSNLDLKLTRTISYDEIPDVEESVELVEQGMLMCINFT